MRMPCQKRAIARKERPLRASRARAAAPAARQSRDDPPEPRRAHPAATIRTWRPTRSSPGAELARYRGLYVEELLKAESGDLTDIEQRVAESLANNETLAENVEAEYEEKRTFGERLSDHLASFGGSWSFIIELLRVARRLDRLQSLRAAATRPSIPIPSSCST